ncbi:hypothetical protein E1281_12425 [Actinomadura sp. KC345]|uniref:hypothetical protein n=1 Tax=Actinomadura sp. KC345 TaxID=2530371 RepID=UPI00104502A9|nr:hypothetical protein [Actinomadura sp. KC345]TDC55457.1 hypothetical protein E1281_12425 [Actinomadura sp. KC345]
MQKQNIIIPVAALFVGGLIVAVNGFFDSIFMAVGITLFLVCYRKNKRAWDNLPKGASAEERPLLSTIILVALSVVAVFSSTGRGFVSDIALGFGGTALLMGLTLFFKSKKASK